MSDDSKFCEACGTALAPGVRFCEECGHPAAGEPTQQVAPVEAPPAGGRARLPKDDIRTAGALAGVEYASFWRRFGGFLLDALIATVAASILALVISTIIALSLSAETQQQQDDQDDAVGTAAIGVGLIVGLAYYLPLNASGGTWGKRILGMRLEDREDGENIGFGRSAIRYVVAIASWSALFLGFLWVAWHDRRQTWHDMAAGSVVVRTR